MSSILVASWQDIEALILEVSMIVVVFYCEGEADNVNRDIMGHSGVHFEDMITSPSRLRITVSGSGTSPRGLPSLPSLSSNQHFSADCRVLELSLIRCMASTGGHVDVVLAP